MNTKKLFIICGFLITIAILGFLVKSPKNQVATNLTLPTTAPVQDSKASNISPTIISQKLFADTQLGISFVYPQQFSGIVPEVKKDGNKIYVFDSKFPYTQGQYIEIFKKLPSDSLDSAIQKQFLSGISPLDCFTKDYSSTNSNYPASYHQKTLGYNPDPNSDLPYWAQDNKCPKPYPESNGISYFLGDDNHPNIFIFVSIGQYGIPVQEGSKTMWQDTIKFL